MVNYGNHWQVFSHFNSEVSAANDSSTSSEGQLTRRTGRTASDDSCECTDPIRAKTTVAHHFKKAFGMTDPNRNHEAVAAKLLKRQRDAERDNAEQEMRSPLDEFDRAKRQYDKDLQKTLEMFEDVADRRAKYEHAFWDLKSVHDSNCKPFVRAHGGINLDCSQKYKNLLDEFFARQRTPACLVGEALAFDIPKKSDFSLFL